jgi:hypothetical protein
MTLKDVGVVEKLAVDGKSNNELVEAQTGSGAITPILRSDATPTTDPFLLNLRHAVEEADEEKRKSLLTALEKQYGLLTTRVRNLGLHAHTTLTLIISLRPTY